MCSVPIRSFVLVRCDSATRTSPSEAGSAQQFCAATAEQFKELGVEYATISDLDLTIERLRNPKLIVLPHNPVMPEDAVETLVQFLKPGRAPAGLLRHARRARGP